MNSNKTFLRGNPLVVMALDELECTVTFSLPCTDRFQALVAEILSLPLYLAQEKLADVAIGYVSGYSSKERIAAGHIYSRLAPAPIPTTA